MINSELDDGVLSQTTTVVKSMVLRHGQCIHTNSVKVARSQSLLDSSSPKVTSSISEQRADTIKRSTQILYQYRKFLIEDTYRFSSQNKQNEEKIENHSFISSSQESGQSQHSSFKDQKQESKGKTKKLCIFQKTMKNGHKFLKRNTKNIPKNFCKAFLGHMERNPNRQSQEWNQAIRMFKKIQKKNKYNNILIQKLLSHSSIAPFFRQFLQNKADQWINNSKITDKDVHLQAIKIYLELLNKLIYAEVDPSPSDQ